MRLLNVSQRSCNKFRYVFRSFVPDERGLGVAAGVSCHGSVERSSSALRVDSYRGRESREGSHCKIVSKKDQTDSGRANATY